MAEEPPPVSVAEEPPAVPVAEEPPEPPPAVETTESSAASTRSRRRPTVPPVELPPAVPALLAEPPAADTPQRDRPRPAPRPKRVPADARGRVTDMLALPELPRSEAGTAADEPTDAEGRETDGRETDGRDASGPESDRREPISPELDRSEPDQLQPAHPHPDHPEARTSEGPTPPLPPVPEGSDPWTADEVLAVRGELEDQAASLRRELAQARSDHADLVRAGAGGAGHDAGDEGSAAHAREHALSVAANGHDLLTQTERALQRLGSGTYGACEHCGTAIPKGRLQAFPRATLCLRCKAREERR